jgi:hypothetical protein
MKTNKHTSYIAQIKKWVLKKMTKSI